MSSYAPFCEKQVQYLGRCYDNWLNIAEGGKRAGKNVINIMAWCEILETHPDKIHLAAGVSVASAKLNIIDSNGYGVLNWFEGRCRTGKYQERDALYIYTATGEKVILISGGGKKNDERFIKGNTYGTAYVTEVNECAPGFVKEVFDRTLTSANRKIFFDLNPKPPKHWFYTEILDMHQANALKYQGYGFNYQHFTIHDNMSLSNQEIRDKLKGYSRTSVWYKRDILGQRTSAEGIIYDMFGPANLYPSDAGGLGPNFDLWYRRYYSIDYGTTNPFACHEFIEQKDVLTGRTGYYIDDEYYYDSKLHNRQKEDSEYAEDIKAFIGDKRYSNIIIDPSAASFKVALRNRVLVVREADELINADHEVLNGIRLVATLFRMGLLKVNKDKCPMLIKELASYIWDAAAAERGVEKPLKQNDHGPDDVRYFAKTIVKYAPGVK